MFLPTLNPIEPPWYGPVCPVVWEGWRREVSPCPDLCPIPDPAKAINLAFGPARRIYRVITATGLFPEIDHR